MNKKVLWSWSAHDLVESKDLKYVNCACNHRVIEQNTFKHKHCWYCGACVLKKVYDDAYRQAWKKRED